MAIFSIEHPWVFTFGILGNIFSFMVYLAPVPTFYRIVKKKSTEGFQSLPYLVALFSAMLWIYYATLKSSAYLLITINSLGCVIESIYVALYIAYAPKKARVTTLKLFLILNFVGFWFIVLFTHFLVEGSNRVRLLGWICLVLSVSVFAAPLSIMTLVVRTKSVEFMPFSLSFFLAFNAIMWFFYGLFQKDYYIALPNILGFIFGIVQMALYAIYKNCKQVTEDQKLPTTMKSSTAKVSEVHPVCSLKSSDGNREGRDQNLRDQSGGDEKITDASIQV